MVTCVWQQSGHMLKWSLRMWLQCSFSNAFHLKAAPTVSCANLRRVASRKGRVPTSTNFRASQLRQLSWLAIRGRRSEEVFAWRWEFSKKHSLPMHVIAVFDSFAIQFSMVCFLLSRVPLWLRFRAGTTVPQVTKIILSMPLTLIEASIDTFLHCRKCVS